MPEPRNWRTNGLSLAPFMILMVVGIGMLAGTPILTAQRDGAGQCETCGAIWHVGLLLAGGMGVIGGLLLLAGEPLFLALEQSPAMAAGAASALTMHALGLPRCCCFSRRPSSSRVFRDRPRG